MRKRGGRGRCRGEDSPSSFNHSIVIHSVPGSVLGLKRYNIVCCPERNCSILDFGDLSEMNDKNKIPQNVTGVTWKKDQRL